MSLLLWYVDKKKSVCVCVCSHLRLCVFVFVFAPGHELACLCLGGPPVETCIPLVSPQMSDIVDASQTSTQELQLQIDEYKEKNRRELTELQRQLRDKGAELEKSRLAAKKLQEEVRKGGRSSMWRVLLCPGAVWCKSTLSWTMKSWLWNACWGFSGGVAGEPGSIMG